MYLHSQREKRSACCTFLALVKRKIMPLKVYARMTFELHYTNQSAEGDCSILVASSSRPLRAVMVLHTYMLHVTCFMPCFTLYAARISLENWSKKDEYRTGHTSKT